MVTCSVCLTRTDTYISGHFQAHEVHVVCAICSRCFELMQKAFELKYKKKPPEPEVEEVSWMTATDES